MLLAPRNSRGHFPSGNALRTKRVLSRQDVGVHPTCLSDIRQLKSSTESSLKSFRYINPGIKVFNENFS